jgi:hypothetical protein
MNDQEAFSCIPIFRYGSTVNSMESCYMHLGVTADVI